VADLSGTWLATEYGVILLPMREAGVGLPEENRWPMMLGRRSDGRLDTAALPTGQRRSLGRRKPGNRPSGFVKVLAATDHNELDGEPYLGD
jgi:hypothetical protein